MVKAINRCQRYEINDLHLLHIYYCSRLTEWTMHWLERQSTYSKHPTRQYLEKKRSKSNTRRLKRQIIEISIIVRHQSKQLFLYIVEPKLYIYKFIFITNILVPVSNLPMLQFFYSWLIWVIDLISLLSYHKHLFN